MLFIDGFEQFRGIERPESYFRMASYIIDGSLAIGTGRKPSSSAIILQRSSLKREWRMTGSVFAFGAAVFFTERGGILSVKGDDDELVCWCDPVTGLVNLGNEVGYVNPLKSRWYYFEMVIDRTAGTASVYVNGKLDVTCPLPAGLQGSAVQTVRMNPYNIVANDFGNRVYDDFYMQDGGRLNPIQVTTRMPTGDRKREWGVAGAASHNGAVGVLPPDLLDRFIYTDINDAQDTFISGDLLPDQNPLISLGTITLLRKATVDPLSVEVNIDSQVQTLSNIGRDWTYRYSVMSSSGYDATSILGAEFGVRLKL